MAQAMRTRLLKFKSLLKANTYWAQADASKNSLNCLQRVPVPDQKKKETGNKTDS